MSEPFLKTEGLSVGYGKVPLISDIGFSLEKGQILALIGPNGAGKSTIIKTIIHELEPVGGMIRLDGEDLIHMDGKERARRIAALRPGRVSTEYMTVREVVSMGRYPYTGALGLLSDKDKEIVEETMEELKVDDLAGRDFEQLSDGQRQRVLLARAMCQQPELLVLDEPTSFLDIRYQLELLSALRRMAKNQKLTVVMSLHEIDLARRAADVILCIKDREIKRFGTPKEVFVPGFIEELFDIGPEAYEGLRE